MLTNAVILHGKPTEERYNNPELPKPHEANWLPWLRDRLIAAGVPTFIPVLPKPYFPVYETWQQELERHEVGDNTGLIGHSTGAEFILRLLSENKNVYVDRVALVAPWRDEQGKYGDFSKYELDPGLSERIGKVTVFNSLDDSPAIQAQAHRIVDLLPLAHLVELNGYGHFMIGNNMTGPEFPELLERMI